MKDLTVDASMLQFFSHEAETQFEFFKVIPGADKSHFFVGGDIPVVGDSVDIVCVKNDDGGLVLQFKTRREPSCEDPGTGNNRNGGEKSE